MKPLLRIIVFTFLYTITADAFSTSQTFIPTFVGCFPNGVCYIGVTPNVDTTCPNKGQIRLDITLPGSEAQYSAALTSFVSGKKLNINVTDTCLTDFATPNWLHITN